MKTVAASPEDENTNSRENDDALLEEIRETYTDHVNQWKDIFDQRDLDMKALSLEGPWPEAEIKARKNATHPRPCEHIDIISQYNLRVVNQARMNKRGINITPTGDGADDKTAELRESRIRQIEYESKAPRARITALECAVDGGVGVYRVRTDYINERSFNQRIIVDRIPNPVSALPDPYCKEVDWSDQDRSFLIDRLLKDAFARKYKRAKIKSFSAEHLKLAGAWIDDKSVMVAEFWKRVKTARRLLKLQILTAFEHELKDKDPQAKIENDHVFLGGQWWPILEERESEECQVIQYITNGIEILETKPWAGSTIPLIVVIGREKYVNGKRDIESLTRKLRAPQLAYDVAHTTQVETMGMMPKSKWVVADGQLEDFQDEWANAHKSPQAYLRYKPITDATGTNMLPPPERIDYDPPIQATEMAKNSAIQAAQNAVGMNATERIDRVAKSGIAQDKIDQAGDVSSYHFNDNLDAAIEYEGRIINELLDKIEDSERTVGTREPDDSYKPVKIQPTSESHPYGPGLSHGVTVSTGPSFQSQRDAASDFADKLTQMDPQVFQVIGPLVVKLKNLGPIGDQIAELLELVQPPAIQQARAAKKNGQQPIPPQVQQQLGQMQQALQAATEQLQKLLQEREAETLKLQAKAQMQAYTDDVKLAVAEIQSKNKVAADELSVWMQKMDHALQFVMQQRDHAHDMAMGAAQAAVQPGAVTHRFNPQTQTLEPVNAATSPS